MSLDITYFPAREISQQSGLYERERRGTANFERLSIPTPNGIIAQLEIRSGTLSDNPNDPQPKPSTLRFLLSERQGTTETTWAAGELPQHIRYDSYGAVRTPTGALSTGPTPLVNHGFAVRRTQQQSTGTNTRMISASSTWVAASTTRA